MTTLKSTLAAALNISENEINNHPFSQYRFLINSELFTILAPDEMPKAIRNFQENQDLLKSTALLNGSKSMTYPANDREYYIASIAY